MRSGWIRAMASEVREKTSGLRTECVLVTGANGFLGRHVVAGLLDAPRLVRVVALCRDRSIWSDERVEAIEGDLSQDAWSEKALGHPLRAIIHAGALVRHSRRKGREVFDVNVGGTLRLVRLASRARCRLIVVSTSGTVGCSRDPTARPDEHAQLCQEEVRRWPYYASKVEAEQRARALADQLDVDLVIVRPPVLLGPGDYKVRSTGHVARLLRGRLPFLLAGSIHFVDVRDVSAAIVRIVWMDRPRPVYHMPGTTWSLDHFFATCARAGGVALPRIHVPARLAWTLSATAAFVGGLLRRPSGWLLPDPVVFELASRHWGLSTRYSEKDLGFRARAPEDTIADTVAWLRARGLHDEANPGVSGAPVG